MPITDYRYACALRHHEFGDFILPGAEKHYPPDLELEPIHLDIDLHVDLEAEACEGTVTTTVEARRDGPTELRLHGVAFENVAVSDPDGNALTWRYDGQEIAIAWESPVSHHDRRRVAVSYRVEKPTSGLYFSKPDDAYPDAPRWAATDHETERARHWLSCIDLPNARPRVDFHLTAKSHFTILANGEKTGETENGDGTKTAHWRLDYPCPSYLTCFAIGNFVRADDGEFDGKPIAYFATAPLTEDDLRRSFGRTGEMLAWMSAKLGMAFPFPKYFQFALPGFGGAMENISLVSWDDIFVMDETLAAEWTRLVDEINLHEMGHSYFGDAVVCRDYAHAWLKESWATFLEQVWFADTAGRDEQLYQYYRDAQSYFREADKRYKRPLVTREFNSSWDMYDAHLYPGGACRLHTLHSELGDDVFWAAVQDYLKRYAGRVVETDDFRKVLEEHSGRSLGRFFDQWFYTAGYPAIKVTFKYDAKRQESMFQIEQTQVDEKEGAGAFVLSSDVGWVIDGESHSVPVKLEQAKQTVVVPMEKDPDQVRFDPHAKILHKLELKPGDGKLRRQLTSAPDVIGRILAGRELAKSGKRKNIEAVRDAYKEEPFWGVRLQHAQALADAGVDAAVEVLADLLAWEQAPMVLAGLIRAAGKYRDGRTRDAVARRVANGLPYWATAAAYEVLGAQRDNAPLEILKEAAGIEGFAGIVQSGAFRGLGATHRDDVIPILEKRVAYGAASNRSRPAAVSALAEVGRVKDKGTRVGIVERLVDLLRDPFRRVGTSAVFGLESLAAGEAVSALEAFRAPLSVQEQVRIDRAMATIRKGDEPKIAAQEKELEEALSKLRKLGERLERLEARVKPKKDDNDVTEQEGE